MKPKKLNYNGNSKVIAYIVTCINWLLDLSVSGLSDVELTDLADGQVLKYDDTEEKWINADETGGTEVEANPTGEPTDTLNTISIDGVIYGIEGGDAPVVETELIPLMTSDTTPSGTVSYSSQFGTNYAGYMAFNREQANISMMTGGWLPSNSDAAPYLQYTWDSPQKLSKLWIETANNGGSVSRTITVQGYNGTSWENCLKSGTTVLLDFENGQYEEFEIELNGQNYSAIKIEGNEQWFFINSTACTISRMQVYSISGGGTEVEEKLYNNGTEVVSWTVRGGTKNADNISINVGDGVFTNGTYTTNPIDVTDYTKIKVKYEYNGTVNEKEVDISEYIGNRYISFYYLTDYSHNECGIYLSETAGTFATGIELERRTYVVSNCKLYELSIIKQGGSSGKGLSDLSDVELSNLSDGQILQYNSTIEKWENTDNQGSLPFEFVIDPTDNGINIVYDDSILSGGE